MVIRNHRKLYRKDPDPWSVGNADSPRYELYADIVNVLAGESILDMGCGTGAFLNKLRFTTRVGFDISPDAMRNAAERYPNCLFYTGSITNPPVTGTFDVILCSDVIYYVVRKRKVMKWIAEHLSPDGTAVIAAYAVGDKYPTPESLNKLVSRYLDVYQQVTLPSGHTIIYARKRRVFGAFTVDYENFMPVAGDVFLEVIGPAQYLTNMGIPITFFVDMAGLKKISHAQLKRFAKEGHDLQLHYHFGFPQPYLKAEDFAGSVTKVLEHAKGRLQLLSEKPVTIFRAGGYQVQPFTRLSRALRAIGIDCDSSVWNGGVSEERGYDFRGAPTFPYWPSEHDAAIPLHTPSELGRADLIEVPISTRKGGRRWSEGDLWQPTDRYNVLISHTKGFHHWGYLKQRMQELDVEWVTMTELVARIRRDLYFNYVRLNGAVLKMKLDIRHGLCHTQCVQFAETLRGMGFKVRQITLYAEGMPNGYGKTKWDTHEVLSVESNGLEYILDPTHNEFHQHSLMQLLRLEGEDIQKMYAGHDFFGKVKKYRYIPQVIGLRWFPNWKKNPYAK